MRCACSCNQSTLVQRGPKLLCRIVGVISQYGNCHRTLQSYVQFSTAGCRWPTKWRLASVCRSYYHLRQIRSTLQSLSHDAAKTLVQAFISSRLDYCNSVLYGVTDNLLQQLQSVQNAAARLITWMGRREHISPVLQELHWLPVRRRVDFKLATLMFKSLHGCAPSYLSDACK